MKPNRSIEKLNEAIDYIEGHIHDKMTLMQIAENVGISQYHLHRIFKAMTQQRLMDYVRNRKLAYSVQMLLYTDLKLIDIAHEFGFGYEQSYIRSFYRLFKISPARFRLSKQQLVITDKLNLSCLQELADDSFLVRPRIVIKPDFWVVGTKHVLRYDAENFYQQIDSHGNEFFFQMRNKISYAKAPHMYIGIIQYIENKKNQRDYITGLEVSKVENVPSNMVIQFIPSQKYAVFTYVGFHHPQETTLQHVLRIYEYIFERWLPQSGYRFAKAYQMEYIDSKIARDDYCEIEIYIPIGSRKQPFVTMEWLKAKNDCDTFV